MGRNKYPLKDRMRQRPDKYLWHLDSFNMGCKNKGLDNHYGMAQRIRTSQSQELSSDRPMIAKPKRR